MNSTLALALISGLGLDTSGLGLGLEALGLGLGLEAFGLGLETPGLVNIPACTQTQRQTDRQTLKRIPAFAVAAGKHTNSKTKRVEKTGQHGLTRPTASPC